MFHILYYSFFEVKKITIINKIGNTLRNSTPRTTGA